ncbi:MAG: hypothetical protein ACXW0J_01485 [Nitrososphaeraceae archaeon]
MFERTRGFESHSPRLSWGGLYKINKNKVNKDSSRRKTDLVYRQQTSNQDEEKEETAIALI